VEYTPADKGAVLSRRVVAENISSGGLLLILTEFFPVSSRLRLRLHLPSVVPSSPGLITIDSEVQVVWTELQTGLERDEYRCGVFFTQIDGQDLEKVKEFIKAQMERCP
jgi:c-di-GMP-binding flagellar brake protein YcgR